MIGKELEYYRYQAGLSRKELALASGIDETLITVIEDQNQNQVDQKVLFALTGPLKLNHKEVLDLFALNKLERRFHLFCIGLPKTGTVSIAALFENYRSLHEFESWETSTTVTDALLTEKSKKKFARLFHHRDARNGLEVDTAWFHWHYMHELPNLFPEARYILLIRDAFSWIKSVANYFTIPDRAALLVNGRPGHFPFSLPRGDTPEKKQYIAHFPDYLDHAMLAWSRNVEQIIAFSQKYPSLLLKTNEISHKLDQIAAFAGISPTSLKTERAHSNKSTYGLDILQMHREALKNYQLPAAAQQLMETYFPNVQLSNFL